MRIYAPWCLLFFTNIAARAENPPAPVFDVASVRISQVFRQGGEASRRQTVETAPGRLTLRNVPLSVVIGWAYDVQTPQVSGPAWFDSERYDILAKSEAPLTDAQMRPLLQNLLADRFKLQMHRETRQMPVFTLAEASGGHRMKPSHREGPGLTEQDPVRGAVNLGITMPEIAGTLARELSTPVIDTTGLAGRFDFALNVQRYIPERRPGDSPPDFTAIVATALRQDLGLAFESRRAPVEVLVIDRIERTPAEN